MSEDVEMTEGLQLLVDAARALTAADLDALLKRMPGPAAQNVFRELVGNRLDPQRIKKPGALLIGPLSKRPPAHLLTLVDTLSAGVLETFEAELGAEKFENPSEADLREVLDAVLAKHPAAGVRCTLTSVVAQDMPAAAAARAVLLSDSRLRLDHWPAHEVA